MQVPGSFLRALRTRATGSDAKVRGRKGGMREGKEGRVSARQQAGQDGRDMRGKREVNAAGM